MDNEPTQKSNAGKTAIIIVLIVLAIIGYKLYTGDNNQSSSTTAKPSQTAPVMGGTESAQANTNKETGTPTGEQPTATVTVILTDEGFSPATVDLKTGDTVKFINKSSNEMWVASAKHPDHTVYSGTTANEHCPDTAGTAFDECATGNEYSFTFNKVGSWAYHNHVGLGKYGKVNVTAK